MEIKELEIRMYILAGQLEEAKIVYKNALAELDRITKEKEVKKEG